MTGSYGEQGQYSKEQAKLYEVAVESTVWKCDPAEFNYSSTAKVKPPADVLDIVKGQEHAKAQLMDAIRGRLNVLLEGAPGSGKSLLAKMVAQKYTQEIGEVQLYDQVLLHNYDDPQQPLVLRLPKGKGREFQADLRNFVKNIGNEIAAYLGEKPPSEPPIYVPLRIDKQVPVNNGTHSKYVEGMFVNYTGKQKFEPPQLIDRENPVVLTEEDKSDEGLGGVKVPVLEGIFGVEETKYEKKPSIRENLKAKYAADSSLEPLVRQRIIQHLDKTMEDAVENRKLLTSKQPCGGAVDHVELLKKKYMANLIVDNTDTKGLPVQYVEVPTRQNLLGEAGHDMYNATAPHTRVHAGKLQKANGGITIIDELVTVLRDEVMRDGLLTVLQEKKSRIGGSRGESGGTSSGIETEPVDANCIIIGCANPDAAQYVTDKFAARFPIKIKFDSTMANTQRNREGYSEFVKYEVDDYNSDPLHTVKIPHFSPEAVAALVEFGAKRAGKRSKLTNIFRPLAYLVQSAGTIAAANRHKTAKAGDVKEAIRRRYEYSCKDQERFMESIADGSTHILMDGFGENSIGVINGLYVTSDEFGIAEYGEPMQIRTSAFKGDKEMIMVEQEAKLSGKIFDKSIGVLKSYFGNVYERKEKSHYTARVSVNQSYSHIEGDSATLAMAISLESALGEIPINQSYAVTGSMDDSGDVLPIGGVNEKIEGFYKACKVKGLTGEQGVIIPKDNVNDLLLSEEVADSISKGEFHIYAVGNISQAEELLLGLPPDEVKESVLAGIKSLRGKTRK